MKKPWVVASVVLGAAVLITAFLVVRAQVPGLKPVASSIPKNTVPNGNVDNTFNALSADADAESTNSDDTATENSYSTVDQSTSSVGDSYDESSF